MSASPDKSFPEQDQTWGIWSHFSHRGASLPLWLRREGIEAGLPGWEPQGLNYPVFFAKPECPYLFHFMIACWKPVRIIVCLLKNSFQHKVRCHGGFYHIWWSKPPEVEWESVEYGGRFCSWLSAENQAPLFLFPDSVNRTCLWIVRKKRFKWAKHWLATVPATEKGVPGLAIIPGGQCCSRESQSTLNQPQV
jgi:hypothetical protein